MKTVNKILIAFISIIVITSCGKDYLDTYPTNQIEDTSAKSSLENLTASVSGINSLMYTYRYSQGYVGEASMNIVRDMLAEDVINSSTGNGWYIAESRWLGHRNETANLAYYPYYFYNRVIMNANHVLEVVDKLTATDDDKALLKGECLAFRAWARFQLVQLYGKRFENGAKNDQLGIVLRDEPSITPQARATVDETYAAINKDLDAAIGYLEKNSASGVNHLTIKTAYGIKARVALVQGNWAVAETFADKAIKKVGGKLQKGAELLTGFNNIKDNPEWMWAYTQTTDQNLYFGHFLAYMSWNYNSTNIRQNPKVINSALYAKINAKDVRIDWWDPTGKKWKKPTTAYESAKYETHKFTSPDPANSSGDIPLMRLAEMYLIKAEAQARQSGKEADAQKTLYDLLVTRNPEYVKSAKTGNELIEEIITNRRIELWGEGFRFTDLKRLNLPLDRTGANTVETVSMKMTVPAGDKEWDFLLPKDEIDANPLAKQNPV